MTTVAIGGTFNILHIGHHALLDRAFEIGDLILIGLTTDKLANSTREYKVRPYQQRRKALLDYLRSQDYGKKFTIKPISDKYGITLEVDLDVLVVSPETVPVGEEINRLRAEAGKKEIKIEVVDHILTEDGRPVSSTRVANSEITPDGNIQTVFTGNNFPIDLVERLSKESGKETILLHFCCAPCLAFVYPRLPKDFLPIAYFYNPNIQPFREYRRRLEAARDFTEEKGIRVIYRDAYDPEHFMSNVVETGMEIGKRCAFCYRDRLEKTAKQAKRLGFEKFTTTLLSSPYQLHELVKKVGEEVAEEHGLEFYYYDIREHYKAGIRRAKEEGMYMQNYCGCLFSERDRFYRRLIK